MFVYQILWVLILHITNPFMSIINWGLPKRKFVCRKFNPHKNLSPQKCIQDSSGTALHIACRYSSLETIKFLVSLSSGDVNIQDGNGYVLVRTCHQEVYRLYMK